MTKPLIHFSSLLDRAAFEHLQNKTLLPSFSHYDVWLYEHSVGFTVAKMMDMDLLAETKSAVVSALENGTDFRDFKNRLKPYLMAKGWWGEQVMLDPVDGVAKTVQLGSTRRLRVIFQTNLATAYAAGQWARIQEDKQMFPYLKYIASTAEHKRQSHMTYYGKIWAADDPIWQSIFPPNGYGCQCTVRQLTKKQALRERNEDINRQPERFTEQQKINAQNGVLDDGTDDIQWVDFTNPRTGQTVKIPFDVTPTFAHNHNNRLEDLQNLLRDKHGLDIQEGIWDTLRQYIEKRGGNGNIDELIIAHANDIPNPKWHESSMAIMREGKRLYLKYIDLIKKANSIQQPHLAIIEIMKREGVELGLPSLKVASSQSELMQEMVEALQVYPTNWLKLSNQIGKIRVEGQANRAFHSFVTDTLIRDFTHGIKPRYLPFKEHINKNLCKHGDSLILSNLERTKQARMAIYIHEFAHRLQSIMPDLQDLFTRLFNERTKNDTIQKLNDMLPENGRIYDNKEKGKRNHFPNVYYGKLYKRGGLDEPLELMTMIFESLLGGESWRYQELDTGRELLYFGLAILVRWHK